MSEPFLERLDVFLPGQGETLTQAPDHHWELADNLTGRIYYSTKEPDTILVQLHGLNEEQKAQRPRLKVRVDRTGGEYHDYDGFGLHLPGLIVTQQGTAIAICQKRHNSLADSGHQIDVLMSRSEDGGKTWQRQTVIFSEEGVSAFLGAVFEERNTGAVFIAFWKMPDDVTHDLGYFGEYARQGGGFWLLKSTDEGQSWSEPFYVSPLPNDDGWVGWNNNCVHGIQLDRGPRAGRLVIPAFLYKEGEPGQVPGVRGGLLYSDDGAQSWQTGAVLPDGSDEVALVETADGGIYISYRKNTRVTGKRHFARSDDGGESLCELGQHHDVGCRNLHAGLARYADSAKERKNVLLFSNPPPGNSPQKMTIYMSRDEGKTWPVSRLLGHNPSRYSDLAVTPDGTVLCLYTNGKKRDREKISVARFNLEWLEEQD